MDKDKIDSVWRIRTPFGEGWLGEKEGALCAFRLGEPPIGVPEQTSDLLQQTSEWLHGYFSGSREPFLLPLRLNGTPFREKVWRALCEIPYGETRSYAWLAQRAGSPRACRAAGDACRRNPIWIVVPCHRIVGTNGDLTGYAGGLAMKEALLLLERGNS